MATTKNKSTSKKKNSKSSSAKAASKSKKKTAAKRTSTKTTSAKKTDKNTKVSKSTNKSASKKSTQKKSAKWDDSKKLNVWNYVMAFLHAAQGVAVVLLAQSSPFDITTNYLTVDSLASSEGSPALVSATRTLFDINLAYLVAAFFFMSAIAHLIIATIYRKKYEENLKKGINKARWYEYGISASTMMIAIAMLSGVSDLSTLLLIFGTTLVMNLLGLVMEIHNQTTKNTKWISYVVGTISGLLPWVVVGLYLWGSNQYGEGDIPTFVYWIYGSIFVFFSSFAVNMYLQYKKIGKWSDYIYGEKAYMVLSLVAKSALAWQVFFGALRP